MLNCWNMIEYARSRFFPSREVISNDPMIFICGVSRSGTTLLSAVLDAHSQVCMGYEMLFPPLTGVSWIVEQLRKVRPDADNLQKAGSLLRKQGHVDLGKWISRCHRLGLGMEDLLAVLGDHRKRHGDSLRVLRARLFLITSVVNIAKKECGASIAGFKAGTPVYDQYATFFPAAKFVYILRDPRDIYASLKEKNFDVTLQGACQGWLRGIQGFTKFQTNNPDRCVLIRYEDLVRSPRQAVSVMLEKLTLPEEERVLNFQDSDSRILYSSHPNAKNLKKGFFESSIGRYHNDLSFQENEDIVAICKTNMQICGYENNNDSISNINIKLYSISKAEKLAKKILFSKRKKSYAKDYVALLKPYLDKNYEFMTLLEYVREKEYFDRNILVIRHDIDHDHITAQKIAKWEYDHGIRSTFCLLHTAWYYGRLEGNKMIHTHDLVDCAKYIAGLGHEICLHNNLAVAALRFGIDPAVMLRDELEFFKSIGIEIKGTATHGDVLCRDLNFRNYELFRETCDGRYGGPRCLWHDTEKGRNVVTLGDISMYEYGLEYEAYEIFWDVYHTDSGGKEQTKYNRKGMRRFGRKDKSGSLVGVLTHPIWWEF